MAATTRCAMPMAASPALCHGPALGRGAVTYELCGDRTAALSALTKGYALREVTTDSELTELRREARYHRLAARFEQPPARR